MPDRPADFFESSVASALQLLLSSFGTVSDGYVLYQLSSAQERKLGADGYIGIKGFNPFFMQYKRPHEYYRTTGTPSQESVERETIGYSKGYFHFKLQDKTPSQNDLQHNILFYLQSFLHSRSLGAAAYVYPLFLNFGEYLTEMRQPSCPLLGPYRLGSVITFRDYLVSISATEKIQVIDVPIFHRHLSIIPHTTVSTADHSYSFDLTGENLCFHPFKAPVSSPQLFDSWLQSLFNPKNNLEKITSQNSSKILSDLVDALKEDFITPKDDDRWLAPWVKLGDKLEKNYQIATYIVANNK